MERLRNLLRASMLVRGFTKHAQHVIGRTLEAVTGHDTPITLEVPGDLRESPLTGPVLDDHAMELRFRFRSSAARLYNDVVVMREVCSDYFRLAECVPRAGELVVDAGANVGCYSVIAALLEPAAQVIAFEPLASAYAKLVANCEINGLTERVSARHAALGAHAGELTLTPIERGTQGTLSSDLASAHPPSQHAERVSVVTLDAVLAGSGLPPPAIIKLDVEGFETEMLEGAASSLEGSRLLVAEWHSPERLSALTRLLRAAGLELVSEASDNTSQPIGIAYFRRQAARQ